MLEIKAFLKYFFKYLIKKQLFYCLNIIKQMPFYYIIGISTTKSNNSEVDPRISSTHAVDDDVRHQVRVPATHKALQRCLLRAQSKGAAYAQASERFPAARREID